MFPTIWKDLIPDANVIILIIDGWWGNKWTKEQQLSISRVGSDHMQVKSEGLWEITGS